MVFFRSKSDEKHHSIAEHTGLYRDARLLTVRVSPYPQPTCVKSNVFYQVTKAVIQSYTDVIGLILELECAVNHPPEFSGWPCLYYTIFAKGKVDPIQMECVQVHSRCALNPRELHSHLVEDHLDRLFHQGRPRVRSQAVRAPSFSLHCYVFPVSLSRHGLRGRTKTGRSSPTPTAAPAPSEPPGSPPAGLTARDG